MWPWTPLRVDFITQQFAMHCNSVDTKSVGLTSDFLWDVPLRLIVVRGLVIACVTLAWPDSTSADPPKRQSFTVHVPAKAVVQEFAGTLRIDSTQPISVRVQTGIDSRKWSVRSSSDASSHVVSLKSVSNGERLVVTIAAP